MTSLPLPQSLFDFFRPAKKAHTGRFLRSGVARRTPVADVYIVNTNVDNPAGGVGDTDTFISLREAITAANTNAAFGDAPAGMGAGDSITFNLGVRLRQRSRSAEFNCRLPTICRSMETTLLTSAAGTDITVSGALASRVFNVTDTISLSNLTATAGNSLGADGGAIKYLRRRLGQSFKRQRHQ